MAVASGYLSIMVPAIEETLVGSNPTLVILTNHHDFLSLLPIFTLLKCDIELPWLSHNTNL